MGITSQLRQLEQARDNVSFRHKETAATLAGRGMLIYIKQYKKWIWVATEKASPTAHVDGKVYSSAVLARQAGLKYCRDNKIKLVSNLFTKINAPAENEDTEEEVEDEEPETK